MKNLNTALFNVYSLCLFYVLQNNNELLKSVIMGDFFENECNHLHL